MAEAWWTPAVVPPTGPSVLVIEKSLPHGLFVTRDGQRFVNEASNYNDVGIAMFDTEQRGDGAVPAWWIVDATYRKRFIMGPVGPGQMMPDKKLPTALRPGNGWLHRADTLDDLAREIGLDPVVLGATIERFNANARRGDDPDFHRGETANDRYYSDPRVGPNPSLGPIETAPFYAVEVFPGDLGTKAGLITDGSGRVLARRRIGDRRAVRRRQHGVDRDGPLVPGRRRDARAGDARRLPRRRSPDGRRRARQLTRRGGSAGLENRSVTVARNGTTQAGRRRPHPAGGRT